ncbi:MAG TPA: DUF58 domain-containing protein [Anaerolineae bacterium]|nr:DUF58 domain-containing protein [Anaerolineae bacterium]HOR01372.1 DUF58 domain-containing protein [Anaerolineae bacterium]
MFSEAWLLLAALALVVGLVAGRPGLTVLGALLAAAAGASWGANRWALHGVEYRRRLSERRAFAGETLTLELSVANRKLLPLSWLRIEDECPLELTVLDAELLPSPQPTTGYLTSLLSMRWFEQVRWRLRLRGDSRGYYQLGPAHLTSGDLFGLFHREATAEGRDTLIVYPRIYGMEALGLPAKEPFGDSRAAQQMLEDPSCTVGIRDYGAGDPLRRVHWKATARRQQLQVRVFEPTTHLQLLICLNVATLPNAWQGSIPELLEQAVSVAGSLASFGAEHKYEVGLVANGCWPLSDQPLRVLPGRSPYQLAYVLEALAAVSPMPTGRLADLLLKTSARLPWGATLAVVTAVVDDDLIEAMERLHAAGRRLVLFSLDGHAQGAVHEPPLRGLPFLCYRLASGPGEVPLRFAPMEVAA